MTIFGYGQSGLWIGEETANEVGLEELDESIPIRAEDGAGRIDDQLKVYLFIGTTTWRKYILINVISQSIW